MLVLVRNPGILYSLAEYYQLLLPGNYLMSSKEYLRLPSLTKGLLKSSQARTFSEYAGDVAGTLELEKHSGNNLNCNHTLSHFLETISEQEVTQDRPPVSPSCQFAGKFFKGLSFNRIVWLKSSFDILLYTYCLAIDIS